MSCVQSSVVVSLQPPHLADEVLHLELGPRVEARRRLVEQEQRRRGQQRARQRHLLLHPARQVLHRGRRALGGEADPFEDLRDAAPCVRRAQPIEPRRVRQVLRRRHALEERRLDRHAVDDAAHRALVAHDVVPEHARAAAVGQQQGRQQADERRLARAVLAQHGDALAARDAERDVFQRDDGGTSSAGELLAEAYDLYCGHCGSSRGRLTRGNRPRRGSAGR
jgi:hypothetical protein